MDSNKATKKVVIIGNGMDLDHNFPTSYWDIFHNYDCSKFPSEKIKLLFKQREAPVMWWNEFETLLANIEWASLSTFLDLKLNENIKLVLTPKEINEFQSEVHKEFAKYLVTKSITERCENNSGSILETLVAYISSLYEDSVEEKIKNPKSKKSEIYKKEFENSFVINYNYTKFYENYYYKESDCWYIHGYIERNDKYDWTREGMETKISDNGIHLGTYYTTEGISSASIKKEFKKYEQAVSVFNELIGNQGLYFRKGSTIGANEIYLEKRNLAKQKLMDATDLIIIGHSLSGVDLPPLKKALNWDCKNIKKIRYYGYFNNQSEIDNKIAAIKKYIIDIDSDNIEIFNNNLNYKI